ncbi:MAG: A24 family peptidase [Phycisphaerales bacterium]
MLLAKGAWAFFVFAFGACLGSLINVLVYRLPRGLNVVVPASRCPACETRLTWRENIPILGWILLRGRCRFCKSRISPEYPIVEFVTAAIFLGIFALWYLMPYNAQWLGIHWGDLRPQWTYGDLRDTWPRNSWPIFLIMLGLVGSLVAMTIVDAKTYTIPLVLPWFATIVGIGGHTAFSLYYQFAARKPAMGPVFSQVWTFEPPRGLNWNWQFMNWPTILAAIAGIAGLGISILMLRLGLIRRSFADYEEWEKRALEDMKTRGSGGAGDSDAGPSAGAPEMWIQYPHARREMLKEAAFVSPCFLLGYLTWHVVQRSSLAQADAPILMKVLGAVLMGYLIGGGVVWLVRIGGSLAFGKEAMGLGDVHMMAAVGACLGWQHSVVAFFGAAFVGIIWEILSRIVAGNKSRAMPYGPHLAVATFLLLVFQPWIYDLLDRAGLSVLLW